MGMRGRLIACTGCSDCWMERRKIGPYSCTGCGTTLGPEPRRCLQALVTTQGQPQQAAHPAVGPEPQMQTVSTRLGRGRELSGNVIL